MENEILIFNHIPKAGGTSLRTFFENLFGEERTHCHNRRDNRTNLHTPPVESLGESEKRSLKFVSGHFKYGMHKLFSQKARYLSVVRDPLERVISDYYFNRESGRPDLKQIALSHSLESYIRMKLDNPKSEMARSVQSEFICGKQDFTEAVRVINEEYLLVCSTRQLDSAMAKLSLAFEMPQINIEKVNITKNRPAQYDISEELIDEFQERMRLDYKLVNYIEEYFYNRSIVTL